MLQRLQLLAKALSSAASFAGSAAASAFCAAGIAPPQKPARRDWNSRCISCTCTGSNVFQGWASDDTLSQFVAEALKRVWEVASRTGA